MKARFDFDLCEKCPLILKGPNGIGKSLFFHYLCTNQKELIKGKALFLDQQRFHSLWNYKVRDILKILKETLKDFSVNEKYNNYQHLQVDSILDRHINQLSGGEFQKCKLFITFSQSADVYFLDEPLSSLDIDAKEDLCDFLSNINAKLCIIEHEDIKLKNQVVKNVSLQEGYLEF